MYHNYQSLLFHCTGVEINSLVILSRIYWVWNCDQTATTSHNQIRTTKINDVYKASWNPVYNVILLVSVIRCHGKMFCLLKCNFDSQLERIAFSALKFKPSLRQHFNQIKPCQSHFQINFNNSQVLNMTTNYPSCSFQGIRLKCLVSLLFSCFSSLCLCRTNYINKGAILKMLLVSQLCIIRISHTFSYRLTVLLTIH